MIVDVEVNLYDLNLFLVIESVIIGWCKKVNQNFNFFSCMFRKYELVYLIMCQGILKLVSTYHVYEIPQLEFQFESNCFKKLSNASNSLDLDDEGVHS